MKGCKNCPAYAKCTVTYRGSACSALRSTYGIDTDPEIITNADRIRAMSDEELAEWLACPICKYASCKKTCPVILPSADPREMQILGWLQQTAEEDT